MSDRQEDFELSQRFTRSGEQLAFADIVRQHVDLVMGTALRQVEDLGAQRRRLPRMSSARLGISCTERLLSTLPHYTTLRDEVAG